jgi:dTMP kinase
MSRGAFIVIEGIDGAGTTTQTALLEQGLKGIGYAVVTTREPTPGPIGTLIRQALTKRLVEPSGEPLNADTMALLFAADRVDHGASLIRPALARGAVVVSDRYDHSSVGYQGLTGTRPFEEAAQWVRAINARAVRPDLVVVVDIDPEQADARRRARGTADELYEVSALQAKLAEYYRRLPEFFPEDRIVVVDGRKSPADVELAIWSIVEPFLTKRSR